MFLPSLGNCANLDKAQLYFLKSDYGSAINECEDILGNPAYKKDLDKIYYLLGLSYLKQGNFMKAQDIFNIIIDEYKESKFLEEAFLSLGDSYLLAGDFDKAKDIYSNILKRTTNSASLKGLAYFRLGQVALKIGKWQEAKDYLNKVKYDYPLTFEASLANNLLTGEDYFTVQIGSFSRQTNAANLCQKLKNKGYDAYIKEATFEGRQMYRVRVGKFSSRDKAQDLEKELSAKGYSTRIFP